ncbi:Protein of unknown function [Pyronema omphalodes CBS 100304]|uniref:Uncharacterized protein n=1 Tax=Pyronema omphalodes (strain CBS 100304) TaxID=1076935 RepID=U4LKC9_PYROM|nr:Protein of unknown function [Pyronema omphalodes CBS 100304]
MVLVYILTCHMTSFSSPWFIQSRSYTPNETRSRISSKSDKGGCFSSASALLAALHPTNPHLNRLEVPAYCGEQIRHAKPTVQIVCL